MSLLRCSNCKTSKSLRQLVHIRLPGQSATSMYEIDLPNPYRPSPNRLHLYAGQGSSAPGLLHANELGGSRCNRLQNSSAACMHHNAFVTGSTRLTRSCLCQSMSSKLLRWPGSTRALACTLLSGRAGSGYRQEWKHHSGRAQGGHGAARQQGVTGGDPAAAHADGRRPERHHRLCVHLFITVLTFVLCFF